MSDPRFALENALINLGGVASVMRVLVESSSSSNADPEYLMDALSYLSNRIEEDRRSAFNAFNQIFGLDNFSKQQGGPGPLVRPFIAEGAA